MHMSLPRETQQIDRIIEAFAVRYEDCEAGLFTHKGDQACYNGRYTPLTCRQHVRLGIFNDDAPYGCVQQAQQEQDDKTGLRAKHAH